MSGRFDPAFIPALHHPDVPRQQTAVRNLAILLFTRQRIGFPLETFKVSRASLLFRKRRVESAEQRTLCPT